jgi:hypothetical protein
VRDFAQTVEELGFSHVGADDHVIGPNPNRVGPKNPTDTPIPAYAASR